MITLLSGRGHRSRLQAARKRADRAVSDLVHRLVLLARALPIPERLRRRLSSLVLWRPGTERVPLARVLLGGQNGLDADVFAHATDDLLWPSRHVSDGPHVTLLRTAADHELSDEEILASPYADLARTCIEASGQYFGATDDAGILALARDFVARDGSATSATSGATSGATRPHQSDPGAPVLLAPIKDSDCYQVVDGHHRLAADVVAGRSSVDARVRRVPVVTPLQDVLDRMSWIGGTHELYQPVSAPELDRSWTTVRRCTDRLQSMDRLLGTLGIEAEVSSYLDVASCYGWFLSSMQERGFAVQGVERDPLGATLGEAVYGLDRSHVHTGDAVDFLEERADRGERFDVVSCFSLLHHFALGRASTDAAGLMRLLDDVTGRVLFLDTGQAHESWFRSSLPEWDTDYVRSFLEEHGTFDRVVDLGPDRDAVGPYADNYGRHLFACIRER
ncbi:methyltransferase domain-containing protein [Nocardioides sp.]|uniref:methyltransferase domain-containing protein n=1 Tax=Nocardioides sp. TaxID=35761 RepID=UPI00286B4136|nr:methyltransferase domain-containing protein [Nocardioides sp.]